MNPGIVFKGVSAEQATIYIQWLCPKETDVVSSSGTAISSMFEKLLLLWDCCKYSREICGHVLSLAFSYDRTGIRDVTDDWKGRRVGHDAKFFIAAFGPLSRAALNLTRNGRFFVFRWRSTLNELVQRSKYVGAYRQHQRPESL